MALDLGKQVGPLPLGAWLAVVGVGGAIAYNARGSEDAPVYVEDGSIPDGVGEGGSAVGWTPVAPITTDAPSTDPETNEEWQRAAVAYLISRKNEPSASALAISKYLNEARLTVWERRLVNSAIRKFGLPPVPPLGPFGGMPAPVPPGKPDKPGKPKPNKPNKPKAGKKPTPKPGGTAKNPKIRYHTVRPGNTLSSIAMKYYGNPQAFRRIFEANRKGKRRDDGSPGILASPNVVLVGQKLIIP